jgi:hypothetical protein
MVTCKVVFLSHGSFLLLTRYPAGSGSGSSLAHFDVLMPATRGAC